MDKKLCLASIGVILVFAIVLMVVMPSLTPSTETETQNSLKEISRNTYYGCLAGNLVSSFPKVVIQDEFGEREVIAYPPEYGGAYIDKSNTLHILLTKTANLTTKSSYLEIMDNDEDIIFDVADFPLSRLYEIQRTLDGVMLEFGIECTSLNETANRLDLYLLDGATEKEITDFLENKFNDFDVNCLTFNGPLGIELTATDTTRNPWHIADKFNVQSI